MELVKYHIEFCDDGDCGVIYWCVSSMFRFIFKIQPKCRIFRAETGNNILS